MQGTASGASSFGAGSVPPRARVTSSATAARSAATGILTPVVEDDDGELRLAVLFEVLASDPPQMVWRPGAEHRALADPGLAIDDRQTQRPSGSLDLRTLALAAEEEGNVALESSKARRPLYGVSTSAQRSSDRLRLDSAAQAGQVVLGGTHRACRSHAAARARARFRRSPRRPPTSDTRPSRARTSGGERPAGSTRRAGTRERGKWLRRSLAARVTGRTTAISAWAR